VNGRCAALAGRIKEFLIELERVVSRAEALRDKALHSGDDGYWDGVALNLHGFYVGVERILEDIARVMEESVPAGPDWHQDLLLQMSAEMSGIRPSVIRRNTRHCLDEYRAFRHVVRNVYAFNLHPPRLQELVAGLRACFEAVSYDLTDFAAFLELLARSDESPADA
jgi:hypothetical protein